MRWARVVMIILLRRRYYSPDFISGMILVLSMIDEAAPFRRQSRSKLM